MGVRKKNKAGLIKEANKNIAFAKLMKCPTSPRKMRLVADQIRGLDINIALNILKTDSKESSNRMRKLLLSCMANWKEKNKDKSIENTNLFIKEVYVDSARMLKRIQPGCIRSIWDINNFNYCCECEKEKRRTNINPNNLIKLHFH